MREGGIPIFGLWGGRRRLRSRTRALSLPAMSAARRSATIAQDAFAVAPQLLGLPLASARRRAFAMAIDLILVSILIKFGGALLAFAAAFVLWKISGRASGAGRIRGGVRTV